MDYHKSRVLIGCSIKPSICDRPWHRNFAGFDKLNYKKIVIESFFVLFLPEKLVNTKTIRPLGLMDYKLNSPFGLRPHELLLAVHSSSWSNC